MRATVALLLLARSAEAADPSYAPVIGAITDACARAGVDVGLGSLVVDADDRPVEVPRLVARADVDGFLVLGSWLSRAAVAALRRATGRSGRR